MDVAVVIGVGATAGLGAAIARKFAAQGLHVVAVGRTPAKIEKVAAEIVDAGGQATSFVADATIADDLERLLDFATGLGSVKAVLANVGNNQPIAFSDLSEAQFEDFWRRCTLSGFLVAKRFIPAMLTAGGSLLFTGASSSMRGKPNFGHFSAAKAGLRSLAQALAKEYGPQGIHVGHVVVDGVINGEMVKSKYGDYLEGLGEDGSLEPEAIAEIYWQMHQQPRNAWSFEIDVRPFKERW